MTNDDIRRSLQDILNQKMPGATIETFQIKISQTFSGEPSIESIPHIPTDEKQERPQTRKRAGRKPAKLTRPAQRKGDAPLYSIERMNYTTAQGDITIMKRWIRAAVKLGWTNEFQNEAFAKVGRLHYHTMSDGEKIQILNIFKDIQKEALWDDVKFRDIKRARKGV